ncbi:MAG: hypothetical protein WKF57_03905 [Nakamurella sp.]
MSNSSRIQAGIPTGGQFAATNRPESEVALDAAAPAAEDGRDRAWMDAENAELEADMERLHALSDRIEMRAARLIAATVRDIHPNARYVELEVTDQGGDSKWINDVYDADRNSILTEEVSDSDELNYLAGCLTERGAWQAAESHDGYLDLDEAASLERPAPTAPSVTATDPATAG